MHEVDVDDVDVKDVGDEKLNLAAFLWDTPCTGDFGNKISASSLSCINLADLMLIEASLQSQIGREAEENLAVPET